MIEDKLQNEFNELILDFSQGNLELYQKLLDERPLVYKIIGMEQPYIMVDYTRKMSSDRMEHRQLVGESIRESCVYGMFSGYNSK